MNGDKWEGWEASEERREQEEREGNLLGYSEKDLEVPEGTQGVVWFSPQPPQGGLRSVGGGVTVTTHKGRTVVVGVHPDTVTTPEQMEDLRERADRILDDVEAQQEYMERIQSWMSTLIGTVGKAMSGEDPDTLWKMATLLYDYEQACKLAEGKGYLPQQWNLKTLLEMLPDFANLDEIEHEEGEENE